VLIELMKKIYLSKFIYYNGQPHCKKS